MNLVLEPVRESRIEQPHSGDVETVEPDHRFVTRISMIVPLPVGGQHQIERVHYRFFTVESGVSTTSFHDETQRTLGMAVARGDLAGQNQLEPGIEAAGDRRLPANAWVFEDQDTPLGLFGADQVARPHQVIASLVVGPAMGDCLGLWLGLHQRMEHFPQGGQRLRVHLVVKRL